MKSKSLRMALEKFNEAKEGSSSEEGFEVMNLDEAAASRGGLIDCTCRGASSTYTKPPDKCTCDAGGSYSGRIA
jgi:hypothetical protein